MTIEVRARRRTWPMSLLSTTLAVLASMTAGAAVTAPEPMTTAEMTMSSGWDAQMDGEGKLWLAYYDTLRLLRLRMPDGAERLIVPEGRGQAPSGLAMAALDQGAALLWRDKVPEKGLYVARADQPQRPAVELAGTSQPLVRFESAVAGGRLHALWYGEAPVEGSSDRYNLYYRSMDLADTETPSEALSPTERVLPGIYPVWATDPSGAVMVFSWLANETPQRIAARFRPAGADAFGETLSVAEVPGITPIFRAFRSGNRWFAVWLSQYGPTRTEFLLEGAYTDDEGKTWTAFAFDDLRGFDMASLDVIADDAGHILIAATARQRVEDVLGKHDIKLIRSLDRGTTWSAAESLRPAALAGEFQARYPSLAFGAKPGEVLLVWEDWREIRGRVYAAFSTDYGATWALNNVPLPHTPETNLTLTSRRNGLYRHGDRFELIAEQATSDKLAFKSLVRLSFTAEDLGELAAAEKSAPAPEAAGADAATDPRSEAALRERIQAFWKAMLEKDFDTTYAMQDPFFRARHADQTYKSNMGRILYADFKIDEVKVDGARAEVKTRVRASIPPFRAKTGEIISRPEEEIAIPEVWVWVDDAWYREYYSDGQEARFTPY